MKYRGAMIGLSLFMVVAVTLTWLVYVTLRRDVAGDTVATPRCSPMCSACARAMTSGWRACGSAGSRRSNCRAIRPRCPSWCRADQQRARQHRRLGDLPEHRRPAVSRSVPGQHRRARTAAGRQRHPGRAHRPVLRRGRPAQRVRAAVQPAQPRRDADNLTKGVIAVAAGR